jgi:hypothetical protein
MKRRSVLCAAAGAAFAGAWPAFAQTQRVMRLGVLGLLPASDPRAAVNRKLNGAEIGRIATESIDRVLRGAKSADLPIRQPTLFDLVSNQKIARAMGLLIPQSVLPSATEVVQ